MKNFKVKIISAVVILSTIMPGAIAKAEEVNSSNKVDSNITKLQQRIENLEEWKQEKTAIEPKKDIIKQNHETIVSLRDALKEKRETIKNQISENKQNNKKLTSGDKAKLQEQRKALKDDVSALKSTKGQIKNYWEAIKQDKANKNYTDIDKQLDNITTTQTSRKDLLSKISEKLDGLLTILKTAAGI